MNNKVKGALIATAVAGLFAVSACGGSTDNNSNNTNNNTNSSSKTFKCEGGNACSAQGKCEGAGHDCAGKNECKGKGWIYTADQAECDAEKAKQAG